MKYESELINEILEQRGHEVPNLHYQSECIEEWINKYRWIYPKICDYESEWMNYINENPIGEIVLDGTEDWQKDGYTGYYIPMNDLIRADNYQQVLTSDRLPIGRKYTDSYTTPTLSGYPKNEAYPNQNWLYIVGSGFSSVNELKTWLSQNPTTVQYLIATESLKTIGLSDGEE